MSIHVTLLTNNIFYLVWDIHKTMSISFKLYWIQNKSRCYRLMHKEQCSVCVFGRENCIKSASILSWFELQCVSLLQCQRQNATALLVAMPSTMLLLLSTTLNGASPHDLLPM